MKAKLDPRMVAVSTHNLASALRGASASPDRIKASSQGALMTAMDAAWSVSVRQIHHNVVILTLSLSKGNNEPMERRASSPGQTLREGDIHRTRKCSPSPHRGPNSENLRRIQQNRNRPVIHQL